MKRRIFICLLIMLTVSAIGLSGWFFGKEEAQGTEKQTEEEAVKVQKEPLELKVTLQKHYIDGNVKETTHTETVWAMQDFWAYYDGWKVIDQSEGKIKFRKNVTDISPYLKENGYFGMKNGNLSIFEGKPANEQVIQSFYQIDTSELESYQSNQLQNGIKIESKDVYKYVLEAYRRMIPTKSVSS